jgi:Fe-S-cluster containining protein
VCCKYLALPLDEPTTARDFDDMRWYLMHEGITIFVEDGEWFIQFATRCKNLSIDNLCQVYETRPKICREYKAGECDYVGGAYAYDLLFTHVGQLEEYAAEKLKPKKPKSRPAKRRNQVGVKKRGSKRRKAG